MRVKVLIMESDASEFLYRFNIGLDTSILITKFSSISVSILSFKIEGDSVQYQLTGDIPKSLLNVDIPVTDRPTNVSPAFS